MVTKPAFKTTITNIKWFIKIYNECYFDWLTRQCVIDLWPLNQIKWQLVATWSESPVISFSALLLIRSHVSLLQLVSGWRSWRSESQKTRHKSPPLLPLTHQHTHISPPPSCVLPDQRTSMWALWFEVENMALNQSHKSQTDSDSLLTTRTHVQEHERVRTFQTELSGLCSHQRVARDRGGKK